MEQNKLWLPVDPKLREKIQQIADFIGTDDLTKACKIAIENYIPAKEVEKALNAKMHDMEVDVQRLDKVVNKFAASFSRLIKGRESEIIDNICPPYNENNG